MEQEREQVGTSHVIVIMKLSKAVLRKEQKEESTRKQNKLHNQSDIKSTAVGLSGQSVPGEEEDLGLNSILRFFFSKCDENLQIDE